MSEAVKTLGICAVLAAMVFLSFRYPEFAIWPLTAFWVLLTIRLWWQIRPYLAELHWHDAFWTLINGGVHCWKCECDGDDWDDGWIDKPSVALDPNAGPNDVRGFEHIFVNGKPLVPDSAAFSDDKVQLPGENSELSDNYTRILDDLQYNAAMKVRGEEIASTHAVYKGDSHEQCEAGSKVQPIRKSAETDNTPSDARD